MADQPVVHIGENSPEHVAYQLMLQISFVEGKVLHGKPGGKKETASRQWILDTFSECMIAVRAPGRRLKEV